MPKNKISADVYLQRTSPSSLKTDVLKCLVSNGIKNFDPNKPTLIKINGNCNKYYPGSNTSPWFLDALLWSLKQLLFSNITVIEGNLFEFTVEDMLIKTKLGEVIKHHHVHHQNYEKMPRNKLTVPKILEGKQIINAPVMHTHGFAKISCATKNMWGFLPVTRRHLHYMLNQKLLEMYKNIPMFTVVDGTVGMFGDSTRTGIPKTIGLIASGWDTLTIDYIVAQILGFKTTEIPLLIEAKSQKIIKYFKVFGDYSKRSIPTYDFSYQDTTERKVTRWLEGLDSPNPVNKITGWLLHSLIIDYLYNHLRMIYNDYQFSKKRSKIITGDWQIYEKCVPYINFPK